eukprot:scaffold85340_cov69-Phaeocystis_antarctica.AAC.5
MLPRPRATVPHLRVTVAGVLLPCDGAEARAGAQSPQLRRLAGPIRARRPELDTARPRGGRVVLCDQQRACGLGWRGEFGSIRASTRDGAREERRSRHRHLPGELARGGFARCLGLRLLCTKGRGRRDLVSLPGRALTRDRHERCLATGEILFDVITKERGGDDDLALPQWPLGVAPPPLRPASHEVGARPRSCAADARWHQLCPGTVQPPPRPHGLSHPARRLAGGKAWGR